MGRRYTVPFRKITVSTIGDLAGYVAAAGKFSRLLRFWVDECDNPSLVSAFDLDISIWRYTSNVSQGTGYTGQNPVALDPGDGAASGTGWIGPTSAIATTSGSKVLVWAKSCHLYQGLDVMLGDGVPVINLEGAIMQILTAPPSGTIMSGGILIEEIGG